MFISTSYAETKDSSTLLLTEKSGKFTMEFLNDDNITALQFDVILSGVNKSKMKNMKLKSCVSGLPKTHIGVCTVKNNRLRVIVYSQTNAVLDSGVIGSFNTNIIGKATNVEVKSIVMGTPDLKEIKGEAIVDLSYKPAFDREDFSK
jgi:hypothetical protein